MKKFLSLLLVLTLLPTCVACGKTDSTDSTTTSTTTQDSSTNSTNNETDEEETTTKKSSKEDSTTIKEEITTKPSGNETTTKKDSTTTTEKQTETTTKKSLFPNWPFGGSDKTTTTTKPIVTETTTKKTNTKPTTNTTTTTTKPATLTTAEILDLVNTTTAKAAKSSYKLTRTGTFTKNVNFGSATTILNQIINMVDENATLDTVIGGFLGIGTKTCNVKKGSGDIDYKYLMKAMSLTSSDITSVTASGNKYTIKIKNCSNPSSDSPLASATNDYTTVNEINSSIKDFGIGNMISVSSGQFNYTSIVINATIDNGVLTALDYSYLLDFRIDLKISGTGAIGTGGAQIRNKYTNIQY